MLEILCVYMKLLEFRKCLNSVRVQSTVAEVPEIVDELKTFLMMNNMLEKINKYL